MVRLFAQSIQYPARLCNDAGVDHRGRRGPCSSAGLPPSRCGPLLLAPCLVLRTHPFCSATINRRRSAKSRSNLPVGSQPPLLGNLLPSGEVARSPKMLHPALPQRPPASVLGNNRSVICDTFLLWRRQEI